MLWHLILPSPYSHYNHKIELKNPCFCKFLLFPLTHETDLWNNMSVVFQAQNCNDFYTTTNILLQNTIKFSAVHDLRYCCSVFMLFSSFYQSHCKQQHKCCIEQTFIQPFENLLWGPPALTPPLKTHHLKTHTPPMDTHWTVPSIYKEFLSFSGNFDCIVCLFVARLACIAWLAFIDFGPMAFRILSVPLKQKSIKSRL